MWQELWHYPIWTLDDEHVLSVGDVALTLLFCALGLLVVRFVVRRVGRRLRQRDANVMAVAVIERVILYFLSATVLLTALQLLGIPLTMFAFLGGAIAIGVGFGAQNIINNFISGWILMTERRMRIGDMLEIAGHYGRLEAVGTRSVRMRRTDGIDIVVPNSVLLESTVANWTLSDKFVRTVVRVGVAYGSPTARVVEELRAAVAEVPQILAGPPPAIVFEDFGDSSLVFDVYFWTEIDTQMELRMIRSALRLRIDARLDEADIVIAFPQRDVHFDASRPVPVQITTAVEPADAIPGVAQSARDARDAG